MSVSLTPDEVIAKDVRDAHQAFITALNRATQNGFKVEYRIEEFERREFMADTRSVYEGNIKVYMEVK